MCFSFLAPPSSSFLPGANRRDTDWQGTAGAVPIEIVVSRRCTAFFPETEDGYERRTKTRAPASRALADETGRRTPTWHFCIPKKVGMQKL